MFFFFLKKKEKHTSVLNTSMAARRKAPSLAEVEAENIYTLPEVAQVLQPLLPPNSEFFFHPVFQGDTPVPGFDPEQFFGAFWTTGQSGVMICWGYSFDHF